MTEHERETVTKLCARIVNEENPVVFRQRLIELSALLDGLNNHPGKRTGWVCRREHSNFESHGTDASIETA